MKYVTLGSTGITVNKNGFGALPIQRISFEDAAAILRRAYDGGIRYFDTARFYTDSEAKIAYALGDVRSEIYIATKSMALTAADFKEQFAISLKELETDYVDVMQFHNLPFCPVPGHESGLYEAMLEAKEAGKIRHIGITTHKIDLAREAIASGLYETLQYPFSYLAAPEEVELVKMCKERNMGFICMKGMAGGLIRSGRASYAYISQFDNALPIWGVQKMEEIEEFLSCNTDDFEQEMTPEMEAVIAEDKKELGGDFCRSCGYCMWKDEMRKIENCIECGQCKSRCPYSLDIPRLLKENLEGYKPYF